MATYARNKKRRFGYDGPSNGSYRSTGERSLERVSVRAPRSLTKELKYYDLEWTPLADITGEVPDDTTAAGNKSLLGGIVQGSGANKREGRMIWVREIDISIMAGINDSSVAFTDKPTWWVVVHLFRDKQANGAVPTFSDVFEDGGDTALSPQFPRLENAKRFDQLHKWVFKFEPALNDGGGVTSTAIIYNVNMGPQMNTIRFPGAGIPVEMDDGTPLTISLMKSNNFFFTVKAYAPTERTEIDDRAVVNIRSRVRFTD